VILAAALFFTGCGSKDPVSIILFIGDGMGVPHVTWDYYSNKDTPFKKFPVVGLVAMDPGGESVVGESAASATALATGVKVRKGVISVDENGRSLKTVIEYAEGKGMSTGIVTTTSVTHATPAAFVAHVLNRGMEYDIAAQICTSGVDVIMGGGIRFFENNIKLDTNLIEIMKDNGYYYVSNYSQLEKVDTESLDKLLGLFAYEGLKRANMRTLSLLEMTRVAVSILDNNERGFFLMVEGGQIDWRGHERDEKGFVYEMKDFTDALNWALEYRKGKKNVLILVTADHETGGLILKEKFTGSLKLKPVFTTGEHTATFCPLFAVGPGQEEFCGLLELKDVGKTIIKKILQ